MKKSISCLKNVAIFSALIYLLSTFSGCNKKPTDDMFSVSLPDTSNAPPFSSTINSNQTSPSTNTYSSEATIQAYKYQLQEEAKNNITWEYANALRNVNFEEVNANFSESIGMDKYKIHRYDISNIIPESIYQALEKRLIVLLDGIFSHKGKFTMGAYLAKIEYFKFDLNNDGLTDYLTRAFVRNDMGGDNGQYASDIFLAQADGTYKEIACGLDYNVSILKSKTNGMYDILTGYYGGDVCKFNGKDSYDIPYYSRFRFGNDYDSIPINNIIELDFSLEGPLMLGHDQYYVAIYVDDERIKEHVLYSCTEDGAPKIYMKEDFDLFTLGCSFYAEISKAKVESYDDISFKQMKFIPVQ